MRFFPLSAQDPHSEHSCSNIQSQSSDNIFKWQSYCFKYYCKKRWKCAADSVPESCKSQLQGEEQLKIDAEYDCEDVLPLCQITPVIVCSLPAQGHRETKITDHSVDWEIQFICPLIERLAHRFCNPLVRIPYSMSASWSLDCKKKKS